MAGLYIVFGRFFVDARIRERTHYGITNERLIIVKELFSRHTKSLLLRTLSDISLTERADGSGTITLGPSFMPVMQTLPGGWPGADKYSPSRLRNDRPLQRNLRTNSASTAESKMTDTDYKLQNPTPFPPPVSTPTTIISVVQ